MMRFAASIVIPILLGVPIWIEPSFGVVVIASVAGVFLIVGPSFSSLAATTTGGALALITLTLALVESPSSSVSVFGAVVFGLALLLSVEGAYYACRFSQAEIDRSAWRRQIRWWLARAAIIAGASVTIVALGSVIALMLPSIGRPILAGLGALTAIGAATAFVWPKQDGWQ